MFSYNFQLAVKSLKERWSLTLLTVLTIALGLGLYTTVKTMGYQSSQIPLPHKSKNVYLIQLDNRETTAEEVTEPLRMVDMTYKDTMNLKALNIPGVNQTFNWHTFGILNVEDENITPIRTRAAVTTSEFFTMFDAPFLYGQGWGKEVDEQGNAVIVIGKIMNDLLFGGKNSVGETVRLNTQELTVIGVMNEWHLSRKFYDRGFSQGRPDDFYIPYKFALDTEQPRSAGFDCWAANAERARSFREGNTQELLTSECAWITYWAEIPDNQVDEYQSQLSRYMESQQAFGRFPRGTNYFVTNLEELFAWINSRNGFIRVFSIISTLFFVVCLINAISILLAKFMRKKKEVSLRRALGAKKSTIMMQHVLEVIMIGFMGGIVGVIVAHFGLIGMMKIRLYSSDYTVRLEDIMPLFQLDIPMITSAFITSIICTLIVSIYPIWRLVNVPPASQLKSQ